LFHLSMPAKSILTEEMLARAARELCTAQPAFAAVIVQHGVPSLRAMPVGLGSLLQIVTEQFLSLKAAHAIWLRVETKLAPFVPDHIMSCPVEELMGLGLSGAKARSFHGIAAVLRESPGFLDALAMQDDDQARKSLCALPGVGPWTADVYLLTALLRANAWPTGDLALRFAAADLFALSGPPDDRGMLELGEIFVPWRAVAARLLWAHYRGLKGLKQA
jgi:DNA-3-methyladenine glycosylase II